MDNMTLDAANDWAGHSPVTSNVLFKVLIKTLGGDANISYAERVLFTACEFWADAKNHTLGARLANGGVQELRAAEQAFAAIGLVRVSAILRFESMCLTGADSRVSWQTIASRIETALAEADEPVDVRLAEFAIERTRRD
jgi:hypothetical protein